jgi:transposase
MHPPGCQSIFLYDEAVDMRKSFEGLSALVEAAFPGTLLTGSLFLFLNRRRNLIKVLFWEGDGFVIWYKRLEQGTFPECFPKSTELTRQQYVLLLEGIVPKRLSRRFSL